MKDINEVESSCKLVENNGRVVAQIEYASAICCLMYATHCTRPDIAYVVCKLSRYTSNPSQDNWKAIGRVFGYLKRTRQLALYYDRFPAVLEGYSDASWITGSSDSKSTTGWIFTLGGGAVCWGSNKQTCITHSTIEAEFLALAAAGKEAEWLRNMLLDIELCPQPMTSISLHCDSQSTLSMSYNKVYNGKYRHISLRHAYIKELISNGIITIEYIRSCKNLADPFTKVWVAIWLYVNGFGVGKKRCVVVMGTWGWQAMGWELGDTGEEKGSPRSVICLLLNVKESCGMAKSAIIVPSELNQARPSTTASDDKREKRRGVRGLGLGRMPEVVVCAVVELLWGVEGFVGVERGGLRGMLVELEK
nr:zinc finger, CCHC-type [Tanacetum cinerariifolium]